MISKILNLSPGLLSAAILTGCFLGPGGTATDTGSFTDISSEAAGHVWVYAMRYRNPARLATGEPYDIRFFGSKTIRLDTVRRNGDTAFYTFEIDDSLIEVHSNSWDARVRNVTNTEFFKRVGAQVYDGRGDGLSYIKASKDDNFPFWFEHEGCVDSITTIKWDGRNAEAVYCNLAYSEAYAYASPYHGVAVESIGKVYEDFQSRLGEEDSSGYRATLVSFDSRGVDAGSIATIRTAGYEDQKFRVPQGDSTVFTQPKEGDTWVYSYSGSAYPNSSDGTREVILKTISQAADSTLFVFSVHETGSLGPRPTDTVYASVYVRDSKGDYHFSSGREITLPFWTKGSMTQEFPVIRKEAFGGDSLYFGSESVPYYGGSSSSQLYMQGVGLINSKHQADQGSHHPSSGSVSLVSFNSRSINGDSLGNSLTP
jgi:hypothetical protein